MEQDQGPTLPGWGKCNGHGEVGGGVASNKLSKSSTSIDTDDTLIQGGN